MNKKAEFPNKSHFSLLEGGSDTKDLSCWIEIQFFTMLKIKRKDASKIRSKYVATKRMILAKPVLEKVKFLLIAKEIIHWKITKNS